MKKLRMNELRKYHIIKKLVETKGNKKRAAIQLDVTERQINRLIILYKEKGKQAFIHGNRSREPMNKKDVSFSNNIIRLYMDKYQGFNIKHFNELLLINEAIDVSYSFVYTTLQKASILSPSAHRSTKRALAKEKRALESLITIPKDIDIPVTSIMSVEDCHPRRERCKYFGELLQIDASQHRWFSDDLYYLHLAIDDATGLICGGYFDRQETLFGYYNVFKAILEDYGIPYAFLTDNRTIFNYESAKRKTPEKDVLTQFGYACMRLGVDLDTTSVSQKKGRIERAFGTFQLRLPQEIKLNKISTCQQANAYLINTFIPSFNKLFSLPLNNFNSVFEPTPSPEVINHTLAIVATRKIDQGNSLKFNNLYYQPYLNDKLICFKPHTEAVIIKAFNGELLVNIHDLVYQLRELKSNSLISDNFDIETPTKVKPKINYTPPKSHPWKDPSYYRYLEKLKERSNP